MQKGIQQPLPGYEPGFDHPIETRFVTGCSPVTDIDVHRYLGELDEHVTVALVESVAACMAELEDVGQRAILHSDSKRVATAAGPIWKILFRRIDLALQPADELTEKEYEHIKAARNQILAAHIQQASAMTGDRIDVGFALVAQRG